MNARVITRNKTKDNNPFGGMVELKMAGVILPGVVLGGIYLFLASIFGGVIP